MTKAEILSEHARRINQYPLADIYVWLLQTAPHNAPPGYSGSAVPPLPVMHFRAVHNPSQHSACRDNLFALPFVVSAPLLLLSLHLLLQVHLYCLHYLFSSIPSTVLSYVPELNSDGMHSIKINSQTHWN